MLNETRIGINPDLMFGRQDETSPESQTQAEELISKIMGELGSNYYLESAIRQVDVNGNGLLIYRTISFKKPGLFKSRSEYFGARPFLTLITDSRRIRDIELETATEEMRNSHPVRVDGWMPEDGRNLVNQTIGFTDIPKRIRLQLLNDHVPYFATAVIFKYVSQGLSAQTYLSDALRSARNG